MSSIVSGPFLRNRRIQFGLCVIAVVVFALWGQKRLSNAVSELESLERQVRFSQGGKVTPSPAALDSLTKANTELENMMARLDGLLFQRDSSQPAEFSGNSTTAYFELVGFIEEMTQMFSEADVRLSEQVRFGFSEFEQQGPDPLVLGAVMRQMQAAKSLLRPLSAAKPKAIVFLKRELLPVTESTPSMLQQASGVSQSFRSDYDDTVAGGVKSEVMESFSFELEFEGYTDSLREYLKRLWEIQIPVVVTDLEVRPLDRFESDESDQVINTRVNPFDLLNSEQVLRAEEGTVPIIRNNLSAFKLRMEVYTGKELTSNT